MNPYKLYVQYVIFMLFSNKINLMKKIGVGLASFGMSGQVFHGPLLKVNPAFRMVSILERSKNLSAGIFPGSRIVRSYDELLSDPDIELLVVNTPDTLHYEMADAALRAGKHVVIEKPFVHESRQGTALIELAARKRLVLSVFQNRRWDGDFLTIRKILDEGLLGELVEYEAHFDRFRNFIPANTWKEAEVSGSTLYNLGSHLIDQALVLFGKPEYVYADIRTLRPGGAIDDAFTLMLGYSGAKVTLKSSYLVREPGPRYYLHGTHGSYLKYGIDPQEDDLKNGDLPDREGWGAEEESGWGVLNTVLEGREFEGKIETLPGCYTRYYDDIAMAIVKGTVPQVTAEDANLVIKVIEAAMESNSSGSRINL